MTVVFWTPNHREISVLTFPIFLLRGRLHLDSKRSRYLRGFVEKILEPMAWSIPIMWNQCGPGIRTIFQTSPDVKEFQNYSWICFHEILERLKVSRRMSTLKEQDQMNLDQ